MNIEAFNNNDDMGAPFEGFDDHVGLTNAQRTNVHNILGNLGVNTGVIESSGDEGPPIGSPEQAIYNNVGLNRNSETINQVNLVEPSIPNGDVLEDNPPTQINDQYPTSLPDISFNEIQQELPSSPSSQLRERRESFDDINNDNVANVNHVSNPLINTDLLLKALVFGCVFYILSHKESLAMVKKQFKKLSDDNVLLVQMGVFVVVYYVLNLFL